MREIRFAAFVMTYERPEVLLKTIHNLREQTFPPELILIVDNSISRKTEILLNKYHLSNLEYIRVGYNSGPAGASKIGLKKLTELGYDWIYWGDDDNPPRDTWVFQQMFQKIINLENTGTKIGIFGGKGGNLGKTGRISSLTNKELKDKEVVAVDMVPGGQTMLVNADVVKAGILPEEKLFFAFEDLDFCLKTKAGGFEIYVDAETWYKVRKSYNNIDDNYKYKGSSFGKKERLLRDYYSTRSLLFIFYNNKLYSAFLFQLLKNIVKSIVGFRYGMSYGRKNFKFQKNAMVDFFRNNYSFIEALH